MRFYEDLEQYGDDIAVIDSTNTQLTYRQLADRCDRFGEVIRSDNKSLIFILCSNDVQSLTAYIATIRAGQTAFLLPAGVSDDMLDNLLGLYDPDYVWSRRSGEPDIRPAYEDNDYGLMRRKTARKVEINSNLSLLLSTSGSTGSPKTVRLTSNNLEANAISIAEYLKLTSSDRPITSLPMNYSFGLSIINSFLKVGAAILMTDDSIITRPFWDMFNSHNATSFSGVPFTYEMLLKTRLLKKDLPSLTVMTQAGGKLAPEKVKEIAEYARDNNISFYVMYGQTEATARISYLPPEANLGKPDSIGIAIPGGELSLRDTNGVPITESGIDGELIYRGPNVMQGYAEGADDLKNGDDLKGILATGDVARMDDDGYFYITGRLKRFIKIFGNRVNLDEVELFLRSSGYPAACGGEDDSLCIATTDRDSEEAIKKAIVARYGFHHSAVAVTTVPEIPRNSSGKILYQQMFEDMFS